MTKLLLATLFFVNTVSTAYGQESTTVPVSETLSPANSTLDTIQVQGNKENKTYAESTESISVVPSKDLDSPTQPESIKALNALPNIVTMKNDNNFSIRGINNTGVTGYQKDNVSSILVDDVFQTDLAVDAGSFDLWDVNHAEVYRGPQSTSQGVNSLAGSILLFHNKASNQDEAAVKLGYGLRNHAEFGAMVNRSYLDGKLGVRFTYNRDQDDGFIKNIATDNNRWNAQSKDHAALDLVYSLNDSDYVRVNTKVMEKIQGGQYTTGTNPFDYEVNNDVDARMDANNNQTSVRYFKKINDNWSNEIITAYSYASKNDTDDSDITTNVLGGTRYEDHNDTLVSLENLLKYQDANVKNVLGFHAHDYYLYDNYNFNILYSANNTYVPVRIGQTSDKHRTVFALFDSYLLKFTPNQSINLGLRYEFVKNRFGVGARATRLASSGSAGVDAGLDAGLRAMTSEYSDENENSVLLPKIAYVYEFDSHAFGLSYSEGYRTGGISINRRRAITNKYDPEKTNNYEASYKYNQDGVTVASNIFFTKWLDQQVQIKLTNQQYDEQVVNAANSELYGAETEVHWKPSTQHDFGIGGGYVHTRFNSFTNLTKSYIGNEFPFAPNWTGRASYTYFISQNWNVGSMLRYLSTSYSDAENTENLKTPEQFYLDLQAQYALTAYNLTLDFYVQNVLDGQYVLYEHTVTNNGPTNVTYYQVNEPREFGARLTYFF